MAFTKLAKALAHLAHSPGGLTFAGLHWCGSGHVGVDVDRHWVCDAEYDRWVGEERSAA